MLAWTEFNSKKRSLDSFEFAAIIRFEDLASNASSRQRLSPKTAKEGRDLLGKQMKGEKRLGIGIRFVPPRGYGLKQALRTRGRCGCDAPEMQ